MAMKRPTRAHPVGGRRTRTGTRASLLGIALAAGVLAAAAAATIVVARRRPSPRSTPPVCAPGPTVRGIDVSYYQEAIAWKRVRGEGIAFAFIRATDGVAPVDPRFLANWADAKRAGVLRGAYQFFRPTESAVAQADALIAALGPDPGELPPVIDVEVTDGISSAKLVARVQAWVDRVRTRLHVEPIVYTAPGLWPGGPPALAAQPLWVAHYTDACPRVPPPWTHWAFWQFSERGEIAGIGPSVDLDVFAGSFDDLEAFARAAKR